MHNLFTDSTLQLKKRLLGLDMAVELLKVIISYCVWHDFVVQAEEKLPELQTCVSMHGKENA